MSDANLEFLRTVIAAGAEEIPPHPRFHYPPPIATALGMRLMAVERGAAELEMTADVTRYGNPMGTLHGGILVDFADAAIGTAHMTRLLEGESMTSVDIQINFFRPVWNEVIRAKARTVHSGKTVSRYICDVLRADGKLVAQIASTVMTLNPEKAKGR